MDILVARNTILKGYDPSIRRDVVPLMFPTKLLKIVSFVGVVLEMTGSLQVSTIFCLSFKQLKSLKC
jgi:hypothetical protein